MTAKFAATLLSIGMLAIPAAYAAGDTTATTKPGSVTERAKQGVEDSAITTRIKADFAKDKDVSAMHIKVDTEHNGTVTLSGTAKSQAEVDKAMQIARNTKGVTSVRNEIKIGTDAHAANTSATGSSNKH